MRGAGLRPCAPQPRCSIPEERMERRGRQCPPTISRRRLARILTTDQGRRLARHECREPCWKTTPKMCDPTVSVEGLWETLIPISSLTALYCFHLCVCTTPMFLVTLLPIVSWGHLVALAQAASRSGNLRLTCNQWFVWLGNSRADEISVAVDREQFVDETPVAIVLYISSKRSQTANVKPPSSLTIWRSAYLPKAAHTSSARSCIHVCQRSGVHRRTRAGTKTPELLSTLTERRLPEHGRAPRQSKAAAWCKPARTWEARRRGVTSAGWALIACDFGARLADMCGEGHQPRRLLCGDTLLSHHDNQSSKAVANTVA